MKTDSNNASHDLQTPRTLKLGFLAKVIWVIGGDPGPGGGRISNVVADRQDRR
jgi:hypothetical protein